jgi:hypothetical protein
MPITYRTTGDWGAGKGGNLTPTEIDTNFWTLFGLIETVGEDIVPAEIDSINLVGTQLTFVLTDAREFGPYELPQATFNWRGEFAAATVYAVNDVLSADGSVYLVLQNHTGVDPFDPDRLISSNPVYAEMLSGGGGGGGGKFAQIITTATTEYNPVLEDDGAYIRFTSTPDVIVPEDATLDLPIGYTLTLRKANSAGSVIVYGETGSVDIIPTTGYFSVINVEGGVATLVKVAANTWEMYGDLEPDTP